MASELSVFNVTNVNFVFFEMWESISLIPCAETRIGFQRKRYIFTEPEFEEMNTGVVYLERENGQLTEQTYSVIITVAPNVPSSQQAASIPEDFSIDGSQTTTFLIFPPNVTLLDFQFTLFPDNISEGREVVLVRSAPSRFHDSEAFISPNTLFPSTLIVIEDNDGEL